jgi:hypothetical protein
MNGWNGPYPDMLFHNEHGKFVNVSKKSGADDPGSGFVSLWADLDNDGWLDLVVANGVFKDGSVPQIYRNNRDGTFTNVTRAAGLDEPAQYGAIGIALGDYDKDGRVDILINGLGAAPNRLYHNDGNWHFTEVAKEGLRACQCAVDSSGQQPALPQQPRWHIHGCDVRCQALLPDGHNGGGRGRPR